MRTGREKLSGTIEVDETLVGGKGHGKRGRGAENKTLRAIKECSFNYLLSCFES